MTKTFKSFFELLAGSLVLAGMGWGLWWLTDGARHPARFWWTVAGVFLIVPAALLVGLFAWMAISQWRDKRRCARAGIPWQP